MTTGGGRQRAAARQRSAARLGLRDGVHGRRDDGDSEPEVARHVAAQVYLVRTEVDVARVEDDVVVRVADALGEHLRRRVACAGRCSECEVREQPKTQQLSRGGGHERRWARAAGGCRPSCRGLREGGAGTTAGPESVSGSFMTSESSDSDARASVISRPWCPSGTRSASEGGTARGGSAKALRCEPGI